MNCMSTLKNWSMFDDPHYHLLVPTRARRSLFLLHTLGLSQSLASSFLHTTGQTQPTRLFFSSSSTDQFMCWWLVWRLCSERRGRPWGGVELWWVRDRTRRRKSTGTPASPFLLFVVWLLLPFTASLVIFGGLRVDAYCACWKNKTQMKYADISVFLEQNSN